MQKIISKKLFRVAFLAVFLLLLIVKNPQGFFDPVRGAVDAALVPFQKVFYSLAVSFEGAKDFIGTIGNLKKENQQLVENNQQLLSENSMLQSVADENATLRLQLGLLPRDNYDLVSSFVIGQDPNGKGNWLEIDKGSSDGISEGDSVIVSKGILVGRTQEVGAHTSKVVLLTSPESTVNIATLKNGTKGVAVGEYGLGIIFDMILQTDPIAVGDDVVTSGVGGDIPKGLYVGTVQEVHPSADHLFQQATIVSPVVSSKLDILFVIRDVKK